MTGRRWIAVCVGVVLGIALLPLLGTRPVLAAVTRTEQAGTGWTHSGCTSLSEGGHSGGSFWYCGAGGWAEFTFTVAAGNEAVLTMVAPKRTAGGAGKTWSLDSGAQTGSFDNYAASNVTQQLMVTAAPVAAGSHTIRFTMAGSGSFVYVDYVEVDETTAPTTTTTTTVPPTTTTTVPPTTTTTVPPTTTTTVNPCSWEHAGIVEPAAVPCPEPAATPPWALLAAGLLVFTTFAGLVAGWRH